MRLRRVLALTSVLAALAAGSLHGARAAAPGCPEAARCGRYRLTATRWPMAGGVATVHFQLNWVSAGLLPGDVFDAALNAARAWETANPSVRFVFDGVFYDLPVLGDGRNEIAFVPTLAPDVIAQTNHRTKGARTLESDTLLNATKPWSRFSCEQANGSCADDAGTVRALDLQSVLTQQLGNWLGLATLTDGASREMTMFGSIGYGERRKATLGYGDVLGIRAAYPCGRCRMPSVFTP